MGQQVKSQQLDQTTSDLVQHTKQQIQKKQQHSENQLDTQTIQRQNSTNSIEHTTTPNNLTTKETTHIITSQLVENAENHIEEKEIKKIKNEEQKTRKTKNRRESVRKNPITFNINKSSKIRKNKNKFIPANQLNGLLENNENLSNATAITDTKEKRTNELDEQIVSNLKDVSHEKDEQATETMEYTDEFLLNLTNTVLPDYLKA